MAPTKLFEYGKNSPSAPLRKENRFILLLKDGLEVAYDARVFA